MTVSDIPCPACDEPVPPGAPACPACGIRLVGQDAARLWQVNQQIAVLSREAESLLASMRVPVPAPPVPTHLVPGMPGVAGAAADPGPWQPPAYPLAPHPHPVAPRRSAGQQLLLGFGALLLLSAVSVFALVAWTLIGIAGQALILTCVTVGAAASSRAASTHRLPAAAHTAAVIAVGVSALMALGAWSLGLAGADELSFAAFVVVAGPVLALVWLGYDALTARVWSPTGATSVYLPSAVLALGCAGVSAVDAAGPGDVLRGVGLLAVAAALVALAVVVRRVLTVRRSGLPSATALVLALVVAAGAVLLLLLVTTYDLERGLTDRYAAALALLVLGVALLAVPVRLLTGRAVPGSPAPAAPAARGVTAPSAPRLAGAALGVLAAGSVLLDVPDLGWAAVSVVASVVLAVLALRSAPPALVWSAGVLAPGAAAAVVLTVEGGARTLADLVRGDVVEPWVPVALEVALPAVWAAACAVHLVRALVARASVTVADSAGAAVVAPAAAGVVLGGTAAQLLGVLHAPWEWTVPIGLAWTVTALVLARAASVRTTQDRQPGWSSVHAAALLAAGYAVVPLLQLLVEGADGRVQAAGCWVVAAAVAWYASAPGRLEAGYVAAALVSGGNGLLVWELGGDQVELYTLPAAAAFAVLGVAQHRAARAADPGRHPSTMLTSAPALAVALVPSLLVAVTGDEVLRLLLVVLAGMALLVLGVARALQAPVLLGALTLGLVALVQGSPFLAYVPAWVLLASAGAALLAIGVLWESAVARGQQLGRWVHGLH
jgi:hypothetical protein